jgi:anti-sigma regulatory factor (Ser/Thr protein kinase)
VCRVAATEYLPRPDAVGAARRWLTQRLARWELDELAADSALLVSELVTNAAVHTGGPLLVTAAVADGVLEVGVRDFSRRIPRLTRSRPARDASGGLGWLAEGGRGLHVVDVMAEEWGVAALADGKQVWFRASVQDEWPHRTACPCRGGNLQRTWLDSGRFAVAVAGLWDDP